MKPASETYPILMLPDDEYVDEVRIVSKFARLHITTVPRFKTSGLSGDEWRISTTYTILSEGGRPELPVGRSFHRMRDALAYGPAILWSRARRLLVSERARTTALRKGVKLWTQEYDTFGDAAIQLAWDLTLASEGPLTNWYMFTGLNDHMHCCQPGCSALPTVLVACKQLQVATTSLLMIDPEYEWTPRHRWWCAAHAQRGDQALEDNDANYIVLPTEKLRALQQKGV